MLIHRGISNDLIMRFGPLLFCKTDFFNLSNLLREYYFGNYQEIEEKYFILLAIRKTNFYDYS